MTKKPKKRCRDCELARPAFLKLTDAYVAEQIKNQNLEEECKSLRLRNGIQQGVMQAACSNADADELMLAKQRDRLIRLTEIKNWVGALTGLLSASWNDSKFFTSELGGTVWIKSHNMVSVRFATSHVEHLLATLETDTALDFKAK